MGKRQGSPWVKINPPGFFWCYFFKPVPCPFSHGDEDNFFYSVRPNPYTPPSFALRSTLPQEEDKYSSI